MHDPVTGPISREKLQELSAAPFGEALKEIRKHDPFYGIREGEPIVWRVSASRRAREDGIAEVSADSIEKARILAEDLKESDFSWDASCIDTDDFEIEDVEPR